MQVVGFVPTGWMYEMKRADYPVRKKGSCKARLRTLSSALAVSLQGAHSTTAPCLSQHIPSWCPSLHP